MAFDASTLENAGSEMEFLLTQARPGEPVKLPDGMKVAQMLMWAARRITALEGKQTEH